LLPLKERKGTHLSNKNRSLTHLLDPSSREATRSCGFFEKMASYAFFEKMARCGFFEREASVTSPSLIPLFALFICFI
jgi:hypothetical protein